MPPLTVSEAARLIGTEPRRISDLFYSRRLPDDAFPIIAGRRMIPADKVDDIRVALARTNRPARREVAGAR